MLNQINSFLFQQDANSINNKVIFWTISPFILVGYFITLGITSELSNSFAGLLIIFGLFLLCKQNRAKFPSSYWRMFLLGFSLFLMALFHVLYSQDFEMFFKFQFGTLKNMLALPFIAAVIVNMNPSIQSVWRIIVLSATYTFIYSILVIVESPVRGQGLLGEAIVIGNLGMLFSLLSFVAILGLKGRYWKLLAIITFCSGFILSILSGTRAGWTAVLVTGFLFLWVFYSFDKKKFLILLTTTFVVFLSIMFFWDYLPIEARVMQAVSDIRSYFNGVSNTSVGSRLDMWQIGLAAFTEKPFFGWGTIPFRETFIAFSEQGIGYYNLDINPRGFAQPHNDYIFLLYHFGLVGFILVMSFLLYPVTIFIKKIGQAKRENNKELLYIALTGLITTEVLLDLMMFNLAFMNKIIYVYIVVIFMVLYVLQKGEGIKK